MMNLKNATIKVKRTWPWNAPLSNYENKTLVMTNKVFVRNGKCARCNDEIKMSTVYEEDQLCCECRYKLPKNKRKKQ